MRGLRLLLTAVLSLISFDVFAWSATCTVVQTSLDRKRTYDNVVAAVDAMRRQHLRRSVRSDREFVGAIIDNGKGDFWASVGAGCPGQDTVTFAVQIPPNARVAAFWHTHGAPASFRDVFSPDDVELVRETGRDFYLITPGGELRVLRPHHVERFATRPESLPTDSRGAPPVG